jgi:hypothetical protein
MILQDGGGREKSDRTSDRKPEGKIQHRGHGGRNTEGAEKRKEFTTKLAEELQRERRLLRGVGGY